MREPLVFKTQAKAYVALVDLALREGERSVPRGLPTIEVPYPVHAMIENPDLTWPLSGTVRQFKHAITAVEGLSLVGQTSIPEAILDRVKAFRPFLQGSIFWGAYGPRVAGDLVNLVQLLDRDPDSRQAVLTIFDSDRDLGRPGLVDVPCTMTIQFRLRHTYGRSLDMWVAMRSNDAWLGLPYDLGQFTLLHTTVAQALHARPGDYHHSMGSLHIYERDKEKAYDLVSAGVSAEVGSPMLWHETVEMETASDRLGHFSSRARRILMGHPLEDETDLEQTLRRLLLA